MRERLVLDTQSDALPKWRIFGSGIVHGIVEFAPEAESLLEERFFTHGSEGLITVIGREFAMRATGFGRSGPCPLRALQAAPNLRAVVTLGVDNPQLRYIAEHKTHLDIVLHSLSYPADTTVDPIVAAVGEGLYGMDRSNYLNHTLRPLQGMFAEFEATPTTLRISAE